MENIFGELAAAALEKAVGCGMTVAIGASTALIIGAGLLAAATIANRALDKIVRKAERC